MATTSSRGPDSVEPPSALADALRLSMVQGVGPRMLRTLLAHFGSPRRVLDATAAELRDVPGIGPKLLRNIVDQRQTVDVDSELDLARRHHVTLIAEHQPTYPRLLREIHDPPPVLFVRGSLQPQDGLAIAIVGSRHATRYGIAQAELLARELARAGMTVVSGLARGVDAAAHRGALAAGGRTVAVVAGGLLHIYPAEHCGLADRICRQGAVISESPLTSRPSARVFPQRNRMISGLSLGVCVVEAADRSGALITARHAMEQGREVFAIPGRVDSRQSRGPIRLIRDGARLVRNAQDIIDELGPLAEPTPSADGYTVHRPTELQLNDLEQSILQAIDAEPTSIDCIVSRCGLPVSRVLATLSVLEMRHLIRRISANYIARA